MMRVFLILSWAVAGAGVVCAAVLPEQQNLLIEQTSRSVSANNLPSVQPAESALTFPAHEPRIIELLTRSPFDQARSPFSREPVAPPPPLPPPPRLLGISTKDRSFVALIEWPITGVAQRIKKGDVTELGKVIAITAREVMIEQESEPLVLTLFR